MKKSQALLFISILLAICVQANYGQLLFGTYTVGAGKDYPNLTAVAEDLDIKTLTANVIIELTSDYDGTSGETFPIIFYPIRTTGGAWTVTIRPALGVGMRTTSGDPGNANALIVLNGADRVTFDGRPGGVGSTVGWTIRNTRSTPASGSIGPVFDLINDACFNSLLYTQIEGQNNTSSTNMGLIRIGGTNGTTGNDDNTISSCNIFSRTDVMPRAAASTGIYSMGTAAKANDNTRVINNNIANLSVYGIYVGDTGNGGSWEITGNSIYYDQIYYGYSPVTQTAIYFHPGSVSSGNTISGNYIGGQFSQAGGTWECSNTSFYAITVMAGTSSPTHINNNIIGQIYLRSTGSTVNFCGIEAAQGVCEISGNMIGGYNGFNSNPITIAGDGTFWGIACSGTLSTIHRNEISNIYRHTSNSPTFICIYLQGGEDQTVSANKIYRISLNETLVSLGALVTGIQITGAALVTPTITLVNNQINLGYESHGWTDKTIYTGVDAFAWPGNTVLSYNNTILIDGTAAYEPGGNAIPNSYCYRTRGSQNEIHRNNIYYNNRRLGTDKDDHYSIYVDDYTISRTFSSDYNLLVADIYEGFWEIKCTYDLWTMKTGGDVHSWSLDRYQIDLSSLFNQRGYDLGIRTDSPEAWLVNGKGIPIASVGADFDGDPRHVSAAQGSVDIGCDEFSIWASNQPTSTASAAPALNSTITFTYAERTLGTMTFGGTGTVPSSVSLKYYTGQAAPGLSGNSTDCYWEVQASGGSGYTYALKLYYDDMMLHTIGNEANMNVAKGSGSTWSLLTPSALDTTGNWVTVSGQTSSAKFTLSDHLNVVANLYVMLQGPYSPDLFGMSTSLNSSGLIPLGQPYSGAPWNYPGTESVESIPANIVDWVLVELRSGTAADTKIATRAGFLRNDGYVVDLDGTSKLCFPGISAGNYYVVVRHRNHLAIMSASPLAITSASSTHWFAFGQSYAFGTSPMADLGGGYFGMIAGDASGDGQVNVDDRNATWNNKNLTGFRIDDVTLDGQVNVDDRNTTWNNKNLSTQVP